MKPQQMQPSTASATPAPEPLQAPQYPISGWVEAGCFVVAISVLTLAYVIGHQLGAHPIAFVLYAMLASALVILAFTGPGENARAVMLAPQTWLVGAGTIGMEIFYYLLLAHVAPAHASLVVRLAIPASMLTGFLVFKRRPPALAVIGVAIVTAGILPLIVRVGPEHLWPVAAAGLASAVSFNLRSFAAEFHPFNRDARTVIEKLRITGLIVLVSSMASFVVAGIGAGLIALGVLPPSQLVPSAADMVHLPTILLGTIVGSVILTAMAYLSFSAVVKITTENFTATSAFTPVATLLVQLAASAAGVIPYYAMDWSLVPAMAVVVGGVFLVLYAARRR